MRNTRKFAGIFSWFYEENTHTHAHTRYLNSKSWQQLPKPSDWNATVSTRICSAYSLLWKPNPSFRMLEIKIGYIQTTQTRARKKTMKSAKWERKTAFTDCHKAVKCIEAETVIKRLTKLVLDNGQHRINYMFQTFSLISVRSNLRCVEE